MQGEAPIPLLLHMQYWASCVHLTFSVGGCGSHDERMGRSASQSHHCDPRSEKTSEVAGNASELELPNAAETTLTSRLLATEKQRGNPILTEHKKHSRYLLLIHPLPHRRSSFSRLSSLPV